MPGRIEVRPPKRKNVVKFVALEAQFIPLCLFCVIEPDEVFVRIVGIVGLLFFGVGGLLALYSMLARRWSFAVSDAGIEINGNNLPLIGSRPGLIAWHDVETVGLADISGQRMVGVRLLTPDAYLTSGGVSMSSRQNRARRRLMQANRSLCGYDLAFAWSELDRSPNDTVDLLTRTWRAAMPGPSI